MGVVFSMCRNPDNYLGFYNPSINPVCRQCRKNHRSWFTYCKRQSDMESVKNCHVQFDPDKYICKTCSRFRLCRSYHKHYVDLNEKSEL